MVPQIYPPLKIVMCPANIFIYINLMQNAMKINMCPSIKKKHLPCRAWNYTNLHAGYSRLAVYALGMQAYMNFDIKLSDMLGYQFS